MKRFWVVLLITSVLAAASVGIVFFARGYKFDLTSGNLKKTGMVLAKSRPDGAKVFLDEKLVTATDNPIQGLKPGEYHLKIVKDGFFEWSKKVEVKEELVTEVDALLVPLSPALTPLTSTGVGGPALSSNRDRIAFLKSGEKGGIYTLSLVGQQFLGFLRANINPLALDSEKVTFSNAEKIFWSPNDAEMLIQMNQQGFYRLRLGVEGTVEATSSAAPTIAEWEELNLAKRRLMASRLKIPLNLEKVATASATPWSPDQNKFIYQKSNGEKLEYWVFDGSDPLPVDHKRHNFVLQTPDPKSLEVSWFADSQHLVLVNPPTEDKAGTISLIEIDGTNRTQVYSGNFDPQAVFPTPDGDKLLILTSFIEGTKPNLYAISLR
jgi:hypothetical protein